MFQSSKIVDYRLQLEEADSARVVMDIDSAPDLLFVHAVGLAWQCWDRCKDECVVSKIDVHDDIKGPAHGYQNCDSNQILVFGGYIKVIKSLYVPSYWFG